MVVKLYLFDGHVRDDGFFDLFDGHTLVSFSIKDGFKGKEECQEDVVVLELIDVAQLTDDFHKRVRGVPFKQRFHVVQQLLLRPFVLQL